MFQLSRKAEYAIRGMVYLAGNPLDTISSLGDIASHTEASQTFLGKIFQQLNKIGVVQSYRGTGGGFQLGRPAGDITLLEIIEAIEGPIIMNRCLLHEGTCDRDTACPVHPVWKVLQEKTRTLMLGVTLEYLAGNKANRLPGETER